MNEEIEVEQKPKKTGKAFGVLLLLVSLALITGGIYFSLSDTNSETSNENTNKESESQKSTNDQLKYQFVVNAGDVAETITTYDITVENEKITINYSNKITTPELIDGPTPKEKGEYTITDSFYIEPLKEVLKKWDEEHGENQDIDDVCSLLLISLEISQNRNDDLCQIRGAWYCDILLDSADFNNDGKITVEENFIYYVHEVDESITVNG